MTWLEQMYFIKTNDNKQPLLSNIKNLSNDALLKLHQVQDYLKQSYRIELERTIIDDHQIIVVDIDNYDSQKRISELMKKYPHWFKDFVYEYKQYKDENIPNSYHFYFRVPIEMVGVSVLGNQVRKSNSTLTKRIYDNKNKVSILNIVCEYKTKNIIFSDNANASDSAGNVYQRVYSPNFFSASFNEIPLLSSIFIPLLTVESKYFNKELDYDVLFKEMSTKDVVMKSTPYEEYKFLNDLKILFYKRLKDGEGRSELNFKIINHTIKRFKLLKNDDWMHFQQVFNMYFQDPLTTSELNNNLEQSFVSNKVQQGDVMDEHGIFLHNKFAQYLVDKYEIILVNGYLYLKYENKYTWIDLPYKSHPNLLFHIIETELKMFTNKMKIIDFKGSMFDDFKKLIYNKAKYIDVNEIEKTNNFIGLDEGYISIYKDFVSNEFKMEYFSYISQNDDFENPYILNYIDINYEYDVLKNKEYEQEINDITQYLETMFKRNDKQLQNQLIDAFWEMVGTCLIDNAYSRTAFIFKGNGRNGKSTLFSWIKKLLGERNVSGISYENLTGSQFSLSNLVNKKANITDEMPKVMDASNGTFKSLTSGGNLSIDIKYEKMREWRNFATLIFATNYDLQIKQFNTAITDRIFMFRLIHRFDGKNDKKDIESILSTPKHKQVMLHLALEGLLRFYNNNFKITSNKEYLEDIQKIILNNNKVWEYLYIHSLIDFKQNALLPTPTSKNIINHKRTVRSLKDDINKWIEEEYKENALSFGAQRVAEELQNVGFKVQHEDNPTTKKFERFYWVEEKKEV